MSHPDPLHDEDNMNYNDYNDFYNEDHEDGFEDYYDDSMDGDHDSSMNSIGWDVDEGYGYYGEDY